MDPVVLLELPPHPVVASMVPARIANAMQAVIHAPWIFNFLRRNQSGSSRKGRKIPAVAAPATASVKTTVIWYVPLGVVDAVAMVTVFVEDA